MFRLVDHHLLLFLLRPHQQHDLLLQYPHLLQQLLQRLHLLTVFHPKRTKITLYLVVIFFFFGGFPCDCSSSKLHSWFDNDTHKGECHFRFRLKDAPCLALLREVSVHRRFCLGRTMARTSNSCCLKRGGGKECPLCTRNCTKALIRHCRRMTTQSAGCRRDQEISTKATSQRAEAFVEASGG